MHITIKTNISRETLEDIIVTALEGGSNSWYYLSDRSLEITKAAVPEYLNMPLSMAIAVAILDHGVTMPINDYENIEEELGEISLSTMGARLQKLSDDVAYSYALREEMAGNGDGGTSDIVFQYMCLGEVMFG
jgi:tricorn protease-like protein